MQLDRFVELGKCRLLDQLDSFGGRVLLQWIDLVGGGSMFLSVSGHVLSYSLTATPMLRAAPSIMRIAASMSLAFRSFILISAISRTFARGIVPAVARPSVPLPFSMLAAFLIRSAAGGVLVTKLNERSSKIVISAGMTMPD